ncbi:hypothetical protein cypCar_00032483, partial [Cyprinus carpio]
KIANNVYMKLHEIKCLFCLLFSSDLINMEELCIEKSKLCWVLYCDIMCLDYDGNLLDACMIVLLAALRNVDPTAEEESLSTALLTVVTDEEDRLCAVHKPGGTSLSGEKLQHCINRAITRNKEISKLVDKVIESMKTAK